MFSRSPSDASLKARLISSTLVGRSTWATKSMIETVGVGTRSAKPSNLPCSSGITRATARAAPVVVGMMFIAAARARRRSLCGPSTRFWSPV